MTSAWVSHVEADRIIGCSPDTVLNMVRHGRLKRRVRPRGVPSLSRAPVKRMTAEREAQLQRGADRRTHGPKRTRLPPDDGEVWFDAATAAVVIGVSRNAVMTWSRKGRIPFTEHRDMRWYRRDHVEMVEAARVSARRSRPP